MHTILVSSYHAIHAACINGYGVTLYVDMGSSRSRGVVRVAESTGVPVVATKRNDIHRITSGRARHAALKARIPSPTDLLTWKQKHSVAHETLVIVLDHIVDPQNFGALFRTAAHFNVQLLITASIRSTYQITDAVLRSSAGAAFSVPYATVGNIPQALRSLRRMGFWVYGADMEGAAAWNEEYPPLTALVLGSEGDGLSYGSRKLCDHIVSIPGSGNVASLNVSVAGGLFMYEISRSWATHVIQSQRT